LSCQGSAEGGLALALTAAIKIKVVLVVFNQVEHHLSEIYLRLSGQEPKINKILTKSKFMFIIKVMTIKKI